MSINPMLLCDFYKTTHSRQFPKGTTELTSYFTPRMSRLTNINSIVVFGVQAFCQEYLIDYFDEHFFQRNLADVTNEIEAVLDNTIGKKNYDSTKFVDLYHLGYLPVEINALPEGTLCPIHVPFLEMKNTHPDFAWVPQFLESLISAELWHPMISATVGHLYRQIVDEYYDKTCDDSTPRGKALGDFSFRGQECLQSAVKSSAGWCLSFLNTATVPAIPYLEKNYYCDASLEPVAYGSVSTEHSVMCSNFAVDGDEITMLRRLLTELYPHSSFSVVSDSYDYWNLVDNILPQLHDEIMAHDGCLLIRGDSGNPVEIVTQTVYHLWEQFGGTINSKGYKVLDPHVKAIYGDSITIQRCEAIYKELEAHGFAACNVALGVGSFSMQCIEQDGILKPFTRDTFGMAVKATHGVIDGKEVNIFKDPKTDTDHFKKSLKGLCVVFDDQQDGRIRVQDEMDQKTKNFYRSVDMLQPVFRNGKMMRRQTLSDIRNRLNLEGI